MRGLKLGLSLSSGGQGNVISYFTYYIDNAETTVYYVDDGETDAYLVGD